MIKLFFTLFIFHTSHTYNLSHYITCAFLSSVFHYVTQSPSSSTFYTSGKRLVNNIKEITLLITIWLAYLKYTFFSKLWTKILSFFVQFMKLYLTFRTQLKVSHFILVQFYNIKDRFSNLQTR